jgi:hypothetical protein
MLPTGHLESAAIPIIFCRHHAFRQSLHPKKSGNDFVFGCERQNPETLPPHTTFGSELLVPAAYEPLRSTLEDS